MANSKKNITESLNLEEQEQKYNLIAPLAHSFCIEIKNQIEKLLQDKNIVLGVPIEHRVKKWSSMAIKLETMSGKISEVKDVQDLIGLRLILLFTRDVESVSELLTEHFDVVKKYNTQDRLSQDQFGYSSIHFVVKLPKSWLAVPTLQSFNEIIAEIQVRTLAQHIWAAASHTLQYKQTESVPPAILRAIYRVSALLETVDLEFERVLRQRENYVSNVKIKDSNEILNVDLLEKVLDSFFPKANKREHEPYAKILKELAFFKITTTNQLIDVILKNLKDVLETEKRIANSRDVDFYYTHNGLLRNVLSMEFKTQFSRDLLRTIHIEYLK